jgi:hypothetical protein
VEVQSDPNWWNELEKLILTMLKALNVMDAIYGMIFSRNAIVLVKLFVEDTGEYTSVHILRDMVYYLLCIARYTTLNQYL